MSVGVGKESASDCAPTAATGFRQFREHRSTLDVDKGSGEESSSTVVIDAFSLEGFPRFRGGKLSSLTLLGLPRFREFRLCLNNFDNEDAIGSEGLAMLAIGFEYVWVTS